MTGRRKPATLARQLPRQRENAFQSAVFDLAKHYPAVRVIHWPKVQARPGVWLTAYQGDGKGWPDLTLVGPGGLVVRELKRAGEKPRPEQVVMLGLLRSAGVDADVWYPADLAGRIHKFAARYLTSRFFGVAVDLDSGQGWIEGGRLGTFTIAPLTTKETQP